MKSTLDWNGQTKRQTDLMYFHCEWTIHTSGWEGPTAFFLTEILGKTGVHFRLLLKHNLLRPNSPFTTSPGSAWRRDWQLFYFHLGLQKFDLEHTVVIPYLDSLGWEMSLVPGLARDWQTNTLRSASLKQWANENSSKLLRSTFSEPVNTGKQTHK